MKDRSLHAIRSSMDWPGVAREVEDLCTSCPACQTAGPAIRSKAPPVMTEPFERIAMDVFGSLTRTKSGNKYILVLIDYSTISSQTHLH